MLNQKQFFLKPQMTRHKQYEALRAIVVDELPVATVAKKYAYTPATLYSLLRDHKTEKLIFFPDTKPGPKERNTPIEIGQIVLNYRKKNLSVTDIKTRLVQEGYKFSTSTIARILRDAKVSKLRRRIPYDLGKTQKNQAISARAKPLDFDELKPFRYDCPAVGIFFFLPYLIESGIISILQECELPESSAISAEQACLSMLALKLMGSERLSHMQDYDHEPGLGVFAGLNFLPKKSFMSSYSCRTSETLLQDFQQQLTMLFQKKYPEFYQSNFMNLDFHSILHFGEESKMEKVWCGARGKAIKGANTIFAQDSQSNAILYTRADILRKDEAKEIQQFVTY